MSILRAVTAGLIAGVIVDLFLFSVGAAPFPGVYAFIASTVVGPVAFTSASYIALGLALHFFISVLFALAYASVASRYPALIERPTVWGSIFGLSVMVVMQIVLHVAHAAPPASVAGVLIGLVAHVVFFGLPVAWYLTLAQRRSLAGRLRTVES